MINSGSFVEQHVICVKKTLSLIACLVVISQASSKRHKNIQNDPIFGSTDTIKSANQID